MPASAQTSGAGGSDLFGGVTGPAPGPAPPSADLFDLMGPTQSLGSSQSLNFSMSGSQSMSATLLQAGPEVPLMNNDFTYHHKNCLNYTGGR